MCIQVYAYVHAWACVVVSKRERKSERERVWDIVFYVSQLAYTQSGVWKRRCACKCVEKQDYNKTYQHTLSLFLHMCLWVCKRQRDRETDSKRVHACCVSQLAHYTFTHTAAFSNSSRLLIDKCMHVMHTLDDAISCILSRSIPSLFVFLSLSLFLSSSFLSKCACATLCVCVCAHVGSSRQIEKKRYIVQVIMSALECNRACV